MGQTRYTNFKTLPCEERASEGAQSPAHLIMGLIKESGLHREADVPERLRDVLRVLAGIGQIQHLRILIVSVADDEGDPLQTNASPKTRSRHAPPCRACPPMISAPLAPFERHACAP